MELYKHTLNLINQLYLVPIGGLQHLPPYCTIFQTLIETVRLHMTDQCYFDDQCCGGIPQFCCFVHNCIAILLLISFVNFFVDMNVMLMLKYFSSEQTSDQIMKCNY